MNELATQDSTARYVLAVDVGVTNVKTGLVTQQGRIEHYARRSTPIEAGAGGVASVLVETCREVLKMANLTTRDVVAVGACVPGVVNPDDGVIVASASPGWEGVDVRTPLENSFARKVTIEGEGEAATLAFHTFGPTRGQDHLLGISIGTGISCGFLTKGELMRGAGQAALEAGHMPLFQEGRRCTCGRKGCWEAHAGGGALRSLLAEYREAGYQLPALPEELAELAQANEELSQKIWTEQGTLLGVGIAVLLNTLNPRSVVIGGGFCNSWSLFKKSLLKTARERALTRNSEAAIFCASNPERAPLIGAALAAVAAQGPDEFFVDEDPQGQ